MDLWDIRTIKYLSKKYKFDFSKSLGQNFLVDQAVCPKIVEESDISDNIGVIEIGPGVGVLTVELAKKASKVIAVEIDKRLIPLLGETLKDYNNIKVINQDILKLDIKNLIQKDLAGLDIIVCANLPYYITSKIIMYLLTYDLDIKSITVMVQKEVADRIVAEPGSRNTSILSLAVRYYSEPRLLFDVSKKSFWPQPKVDSAVINLLIRQKKAVEVRSEKMFFKVIKAAFSTRRKTVVNSLSGALNINKNIINNIFNNLEINLNNRAENLSLENFRDISEKILDLNLKT